MRTKFIKVTDSIFNIEYIAKIEFKQCDDLKCWVFVTDRSGEMHNIVEDSKDFEYAYNCYEKLIKLFDNNIIINV